jgi:phage shock protein PspC (stress-responsive transcriptional regulator)
MTSPPSPPAPLVRATHGRWLGGVCAGVARERGIPVAGLRAGFALAALVGGIGVLVYLACWLIVPAEGETGDRPGPRAIASLVLACAGLVGLATLAVLAAAATIFGFGWLVVLAGALVLGGTLASWRRLGPAWALLPIVALVLPSAAVAAAGLHLAPQTESLRYAPASAADIPRGGYESGLGPMLVDLRRTALPASGTVHLRLDGGIRRTIVALPHDRCVPVTVRFAVHDFPLRAASALLGTTRSSTEIRLYQHLQFGGSGVLNTLDEPGRGPHLAIDFTSSGGDLTVRDYPLRHDPENDPGWPGFTYVAGPRPTRARTSPTTREAMLRAWRRQLARNAQIRRDERGPCSAAARKAAKR